MEEFTPDSVVRNIAKGKENTYRLSHAAKKKIVCEVERWEGPVELETWESDDEL
jgi:hypothetical protein